MNGWMFVMLGTIVGDLILITLALLNIRRELVRIRKELEWVGRSV